MSMIKDKEINDYLNQFKLGHAYQGYTYLMDAIRLQLDERTPRGKIKELYQEIAKMRDTRPEYVDRLIRETLKKANVDMKPKHFILLAVDELRFKDD